MFSSYMGEVDLNRLLSLMMMMLLCLVTNILYGYEGACWRHLHQLVIIITTTVGDEFANLLCFLCKRNLSSDVCPYSFDDMQCDLMLRLQ